MLGNCLEIRSIRLLRSIAKQVALLSDKYKSKVVPAMQEKFGLKNALAVPRITKVTVNIGVGKFLKDQKILDDIERDLARITGQKPVHTKAKKAISSFKTREGMAVGMRVTIRGRRMWDFIERLCGIALPRTRDFRGTPEASFDANGNLSIGIREHIIFPEAAGDDVKTIFGFQATVTTTAKKRAYGVELLKLLGFPIK